MPDSYDFVTLMCRLKAAQNEVTQLGVTTQ